MVKSRTIFVGLLMLLRSTLLYAQGPDSIPETTPVVCYTLQEARGIAIRIVEADECDTVLIVYQQVIDEQDSIITALRTKLANKNKELELKNTMLTDQMDITDNLFAEQEIMHKAFRQNRRETRVLMGGVAAVVVIGIVKTFTIR
jgi:hypothetical protein